MNLPTNLKRLRKKRKVSQQRVADMNGLTRNMVAQYEQGLSEPNLCTLVKLSNYYGTTLDILIK